jgi:sphingosine kinase
MPLRNPSSKCPVRQLRKTPLFKLSSSIEATALITAVQTYSLSNSSPSSSKRRVLAIINPASGRGVAPAAYSKHIKPILEAAGMLLMDITTDRQSHGTELVKKLLPGEYDLILSLGGDGTMFEVLQGILQRPDWELMRQSTTLLQIPCGSGNALAASTGLWDVPTAAYAAVKGQKTLLDIASVVQMQQKQEGQEQNTALATQATPEEETRVRFFSFLSCTYGMLSCLDIGTEHLRWLGSTRFIVGAIQQIFKQQTFQIKVAYLDADAPSLLFHDGGGGGDGSREGPSTATSVNSTNSTNITTRNGWYGVDGTIGYGPPLQYLKDFNPIIIASADASTTTASTNISNSTISSTTTSTKTAASESASTSPVSLPLLPTGWHWLPADHIQLFAACNLPQLDMNFKFAPDATLHSGHFNLIYTTGRSGWLKGLSLLTKAENGEHMELVQQKKLKAYWIEPGSPESTWLVCDGEEVPNQPLYAEVHAGLITTLKAPATSLNN